MITPAPGSFFSISPTLNDSNSMKKTDGLCAYLHICSITGSWHPTISLSSYLSVSVLNTSTFFSSNIYAHFPEGRELAGSPCQSECPTNRACDTWTPLRMHIDQGLDTALWHVSLSGWTEDAPRSKRHSQCDSPSPWLSRHDINELSPHHAHVIQHVHLLVAFLLYSLPLSDILSFSRVLATSRRKSLLQ